MSRFHIHIAESDFYQFKRWLLARDPKASLKYEPSGEADRWWATVDASKAYISRVSARRWAASETSPR